MLTTIEMLQNGGDWVPLYTDGVQHAGAAPSWVTDWRINNGHEGILVIDTADITDLDDFVQQSLEEPVVVSFRITTRDYWSNENATEAFSVTFVHECADNFLARTGTAPATTLDY